ncbi:hypothetical protein LEN26_000626 [Aphanomyces euteiches]|nr:hypothetical protein AeMF1_002583 [Aphanomyces euteiches]KAH9163133.1 hypothetical protein LEN26_000626 [Aphanomyces euteiches]KAH9191027.1 hypothetical protein AeNC1_007006 [Aphanomyces euteiches]
MEFDDDDTFPSAATPDMFSSVLEFYGRLLLYVAVLSVAYFIATSSMSQEEEEPKERPVLRQDLLDEEEDEGDDEESDGDDEDDDVEEVNTDDMTKSDGTRNRKKGKDPFPKGMNPLTYKQPKDEKVSFRDLHNAMLKRYKEKYPNHGPGQAKTVVDDDYDDEMKALLREHLGKK